MVSPSFVPIHSAGHVHSIVLAHAKFAGDTTVPVTPNTPNSIPIPNKIFFFSMIALV